MVDEILEGPDPYEVWDPRMRASIEMTEQLATEIHEEVQELRNEMRQLATAMEESVKKILNNATKGGE